MMAIKDVYNYTTPFSRLSSSASFSYFYLFLLFYYYCYVVQESADLNSGDKQSIVKPKTIKKVTFIISIELN